MYRPYLTSKPLMVSKLNSYPKIKCAFHPNKFLTNFCLREECLLPLCPECVKLHGEEHQISYSHGKFEIYNQCLETVEKCYLNYIQQTKTIMKSVQQSYERKNKQHNFIRNVFRQSKAKILAEVNNSLNVYEEKLEELLTNQMSDFKHSLEDLQTSVTWIVGSARKALENLYSSSSAQTVIQFHAEQASKIENLLMIGSKMEIDSKVFTENISINQAYFSQIRQIVFGSMGILNKLNMVETAMIDSRQRKQGTSKTERRKHELDGGLQSVLESFDLRKVREQRKNLYTTR